MNTPASKPLVIDVDDTLLRTDMLLESFWTAVGKDTVTALRATFRHFSNRARVKHEMAAISDMDVSRLPLNEKVVALANDARAEGREVVLASGSDQLLVNRLADRLELDGAHLASDSAINLTGSRKKAALVERYGDGGFDYVGDSKVDLSVWQNADRAYSVAPSKAILDGLKSLGKETHIIDGGWKFLDLIKALRPHQWIKNVLLLLPLIAAHRTDTTGLGAVLLAMVAFSLAASSIYIVNDLLDLGADRQHEKKRNRPFAAGTVPIRIGMITSCLLGVSALTLAALVDWKLLGLVGVYMSLSLAYSVILKRQRWVDIWVLAILYTLRVVAGGVAADVTASGWLIAFVFPVFMALGCVKRLTELARAKHRRRLPGRAYAKRDRPDLLNMSIVSALNANIIFLTYTYSEAAYRLSAGIWELRWCVIPISVWMFRMISTGWKGTQDYDPIVFAVRDRTGLVLSVIVVLGLLNAAAWVQ